jgi:hypothetical protein
MVGSLLFEELADEALLFFVFDAREEFGAEFLNCLRTIKRQALVHDAPTEVTRLAARCKDWFDLRIEVYLCRCRACSLCTGQGSTGIRRVHSRQQIAAKRQDSCQEN